MIFQQQKQRDNPLIIFVGEIKALKHSKWTDNKQVFELPNVQRTDSGEYSCNYQARSDVKITYKVKVLYSPKVTVKSRKIQKVAKGESVTVQCDAKGNPKPVSLS